MQGQRVLHVQLHIEYARLARWRELRIHGAIRGLVQRDDIARHVVEIDHLALGQRTRCLPDAARQEILRALHTQRSHFPLERLQEHQPARAGLLGNHHLRRLVALLVIRLLQRRARPFDIGERAPRPEERIHRLLNFEARQCLRPGHANLADENLLLRLRRWRHGQFCTARRAAADHRDRAHPQWRKNAGSA